MRERQGGRGGERIAGVGCEGQAMGENKVGVGNGG